MKYIVRLLVIAVIAGISTGFYYKNIGNEVFGNKCIGFSVLGLAFVLMPTFIIYRFRKSDTSKYIFSPTEKNEELEEFIQNGDGDIQV